MVPDPLPPALVLSSPDWHEGVVGIVASRVVERFNRPAILLSEGDDEAKGSGRSIPGFDLLGAVERSAEHLLAFGGHRAACGLRLRREHIPAFRDAFVAQAAAVLGAADLVRTQPVDAVVGGDDLTLELADELELLAPHGFGNRKVTLLLHGAEVVAPRLTRDHRHAAVPRALRRRLVPGDPLQLRQAAGARRARPLRRAAGPVEERVQRRRERPGRGQRAAPSRRARRAISAPPPATCRARTGSRRRPCGASCSRGRVVRDGGARGRASPRRARDGRLVDRRGRAAVSALTSLAAGGERVLVLVADVARRRPLLSRDVLSPQLARRAAYLQAACVGRLGEALAGPDVVMTGYDVVAARPQLAAAFAHVVLLDPPFTRRLLAAVAAAAPEAWVHALWGRAEAGFADAGRGRRARPRRDDAARLARAQRRRRPV